MESQLLFNNTANLSLNGSFQQSQLYPEALTLAYNMFLTLVIALGVPGNLLVLFVFIKMKVSSSTDWFIVFITSFDFISSLFNVPVYLTFTSGTWKYYGSNLTCKLHMYFSEVVVITSAIITCGLAVERYQKVCRPSAKQMTREAARNVCAISCLISLIASMPTAFIFQNVNGVCTIPTPITAVQFVYYITVFIVFITVFVVVPLCYIRIIVTVRNSQRNVMAHVSSQRPHQTARRIPLVGSNKIHPSSASSTIYENTTSAIIATRLRLNGNESSTNSSTVNLNSVFEKKPSENEHAGSLVAVINKDEASTVWTSRDHNDTVHPSSSKASATCLITNHSNNATTVNTISTNLKKQTVKSPRRNLQTTKIAFMVCSVYIASWITPWICFILLTFVRSPIVLQFALFGKMTYLINTISNPFLYALFDAKFRAGLKACIETCKSRQVAR